jgi:hypothetical protein
MPDYPADWRRALEMLAGSDNGCTASPLSTHGLAWGVIAGLVDTGLVTAATERVLTGQCRRGTRFQYHRPQARGAGALSAVALLCT